MPKRAPETDIAEIDEAMTEYAHLWSPATEPAICGGSGRRKENEWDGKRWKGRGARQVFKESEARAEGRARLIEQDFEQIVGGYNLLMQNCGRLEGLLTQLRDECAEAESAAEAAEAENAVEATGASQNETPVNGQQ